jgi:hypothetical protein
MIAPRRIQGTFSELTGPDSPTLAFLKKKRGEHIMDTYRWESPADWLDWKFLQWTATEQLAAAHQILKTIDNDMVQDIFQEEMEQDGYFLAVDETTADE